MKKQSKKIILSIGIGTIVALVCGAFLSFYPFIGDDLIVREIQFCTFVVCITVAICTVFDIASKSKCVRVPQCADHARILAPINHFHPLNLL